MNDAQYEYGVKKLERLSKRWNLPMFVTAGILLDIRLTEEFWGWVNADEFLNRYYYGQE